MDVTFLLSAIIFTLLAIVVITSLFNSSTPADLANSRLRQNGVAGGLAQPRSKQNGHVPAKKKDAEDWCEISGTSHDHWDVVKCEEAHTEEMGTSSGHSSRNMSVDIDSSESSSGRGRRSLIGLSDTELLKCAFSYPQTEGSMESSEKVESNASNSLKYVPGKARSHHLEMMMSKEELEEEQRVQREQLAAIFQLLKDNKETFGEVSEGDLEEQLQLYSI
ncbi:matrix-remodeling-associated protein 7 [Pholidichthys leucotaenia]